VLVDDGSSTWIHVEPGTASALAGYLDSMRFMLRVEVEDVTPSYAVISTMVGGFDKAEDHLVRRERVAEEIEAISLPVVGHDAWEALRVAAGIPRLGFETDHRTIPHEVDWIGTAVHLDKGCYRGQETVARVHNLGRPPRRLVLVHFGGESDTLPEPGSAVELDGRTVGFLGTAVHHHELGPIGLAVVKRNVAADAMFLIDGQTAAQDPA
jgi:folate-binding protein YgfZ